MPRAQPGRKRLAVYPRQLALQPHLQILRRSRRPLLCGLEQARRSALAHHVHRIGPMGPRVLIIGIWYNGEEVELSLRVVGNIALSTSISQLQLDRYSRPAGMETR